ncbi:unnamed protein product [Adineta steineri]|uniref:Uncharacterized protein n=1 Tax=Adineta steineri TaxID=433720 RepID=A0A818MZF2_9BILA|nr:unnamed protein product [Adineta steineri]CAF3597873.1 unnamed protein product [Adineta steineri]
MFHDEAQTQFTNNWKRNNNEHPIDRVFTADFNTNQQIRYPYSNTRSKNYKSETKHIIQRQRVIQSFLTKPDGIESSIQKSITLNTQPKILSITSIPSPQLLLPELNEQSTNNNNRQPITRKEFDRQSPVFVRHHRRTIEHLSLNQQTSDITNISGNQVTLSIPPNFTFRNKPSRVYLSDRSAYKINNRIFSPRIKSTNPPKPIQEGKPNIFQSKSVHRHNSIPTPIWIPTLPEQDAVHTRTLTDIARTKSYPPKVLKNHHSQSIPSNRINSNLKTNDIQDLYISPRSPLNNPQNEIETDKNIIREKELTVSEWEDSKTSNDDVFDEDESTSSDGNSSTSTCDSQITVQQSRRKSTSSITYDTSLSNKSSKSKSQRLPSRRNISRRYPYTLALPPLLEHIHDEEIGDEFN